MENINWYYSDFFKQLNYMAFCEEPEFCEALAYILTFKKYENLRVTPHTFSIEISNADIHIFIIHTVLFQQKEYSKVKELKNVHFVSFGKELAEMHELQWQFEPDEFLSFFPKNCIFLENKFMKIEGITFVSVPATMGLLEYPQLKVPEKVDFLLTHAPPYGILDINMGCPTLLKYVSKLKPRNHLFGHIHETGGKFLEIEKTIFNNVSVYHQLFF